MSMFGMQAHQVRQQKVQMYPQFRNAATPYAAEPNRFPTARKRLEYLIECVEYDGDKAWAKGLQSIPMTWAIDRHFVHPD